MDVRENEAFTQLLRDAVLQAEKIGYRPTQFKRMLEQYGGFETVQRVLASGKPSDGFTRLWELKRLDLTCEALIVESEWRGHFDAALLARAEKLLRDMNYPFKPYAAPVVDTSPSAPPGIDTNSEADGDSPLSNSQLRINAFFRDVLHAPVANDRWSWGSVDEARRCVFLRLWAEDVEQQKDFSTIRVLGPRQTNSNGWSERQRHLELVRAGYDAYAIVCEKGAKSSTSIGSFDASQLSRLSAISDVGGDLYMKLSDRLPVSAFYRHSSEATVDSELMQIREGEGAETTRKTLVDARLGQGRFRRDLLQLWDGKCAVTGTAIAAVLRASHCKPWCGSNNEERLDPHNGLPLTANLDALFDALLITFDDDGEMLTSGVITPEEREALGLPAPLLKKPGSKLKNYLKHHRERFNLLRTQ